MRGCGGTWGWGGNARGGLRRQGYRRFERPGLRIPKILRGGNNRTLEGGGGRVGLRVTFCSFASVVCPYCLVMLVLLHPSPSPLSSNVVSSFLFKAKYDFVPYSAVMRIGTAHVAWNANRSGRIQGSELGQYEEGDWGRILGMVWK